MPKQSQSPNWKKLTSGFQEDFCINREDDVHESSPRPVVFRIGFFRGKEDGGRMLGA